MNALFYKFKLYYHVSLLLITDNIFITHIPDLTTTSNSNTATEEVTTTVAIDNPSTTTTKGKKLKFISKTYSMFEYSFAECSH